MTAVASFPNKTSLQQCRACLGICRHCYAITTDAQPCHSTLPDAIVALEIAVALLEINSEHAYDRLCHCAEVCAAGAVRWGSSGHPRCRQSAMACRAFAAYWLGSKEVGQC